MSDKDPSMYQSHPELYRYTSSDRYENPKEDFKTLASKLAEHVDTAKPLTLADIGTGNGEFLYYLKKEFPGFQLHGFDQTEEFIATARSFPGLQGVHLECSDLYDIEGNFDIVTAVCFLSLFREFESPIRKLLDLCRPGGYVFATGLFNPYDIEVRVEYCDNSRPETAGKWQTDFNRHSQVRMREFLAGETSSIEFYQCEYDLDLKHDPANPVHVWTRAQAEGSPILINGAWQIANQTLVVLKKK